MDEKQKNEGYFKSSFKNAFEKSVSKNTYLGENAQSNKKKRAPLDMIDRVLFTFFFILLPFFAFCYYIVISFLGMDNNSSVNSSQMLIFYYLYGPMFPYVLGIIGLCVLVLWITKSWLKSLIPLILFIPLILNISMIIQKDPFSQLGLEEYIEPALSPLQDTIFDECSSHISGVESGVYIVEDNKLLPSNPNILYVIYQESDQNNYDRRAVHVLLAEILLNNPKDYYLINKNTTTASMSVPTNFQTQNPNNADYTFKLSSCKSHNDSKTFTQVYALTTN